MSTRDRFDLRKDSEHTWEIFDTTNGRTVVFQGEAFCGLPFDSADAFTEYMNSAGMLPDRVTLH
ncbi:MULTISPECIES: hypothetical protein [Neorhizobium]|jgi:hypothetical protein|uniref:hypothetical protein n=1 Tax=Neorhizobium sp. T6_25 TaxID=2093833 RepID=UPI000CF921B7|nr:MULTISPECIES: hypothetical protein [Neorhizobium]